MYLAGQIGCSSVQVESDCSFTVDAINRHDCYQGSDVALLAECKDLSGEFAKEVFMHCFREANATSDELARYSYSTRLSSFWEESIPDFISQLHVNELSIV